MFINHFKNTIYTISNWIKNKTDSFDMKFGHNLKSDL